MFRSAKSPDDTKRRFGDTYIYHLNPRTLEVTLDDPLFTGPDTPRTGDTTKVYNQNFKILWVQGRTLGLEWVS